MDQILPTLNEHLNTLAREKPADPLQALAKLLTGGGALDVRHQLAAPVPHRADGHQRLHLLVARPRPCEADLQAGVGQGEHAPQPLLGGDAAHTPAPREGEMDA